MKIIHNQSQQAYQLNPDTQVEIEKPNLFFNDYGEQSLPVDLPDTPVNRELTGYPDMGTNRSKPHKDIECTLVDGGYVMACRQSILSAKRNESISASFYMNDGAFLSKMKNVSLMEIFGEETIPDINTVEEAIQFCRSLLDGGNEQYAIFPIRLTMNDEKRDVNQMENLRSAGYTFVNEKEQTETVDGNTIILSPGYYMTPFIRGTYLLQRLFGYFGYTLAESLLSTDETFKNIVFINNTMDTLVNGKIKVSHLVPDCMCYDVLDVYRKKFCCEFVPNEGARTVHVVFFKDVFKESNVNDLSQYIVGSPTINYTAYKQLRLTSDEYINEGSDTYDSTTALEAKYPNAWYDPMTNGYRRTGFDKNEFSIEVSDGHIPYYGGGELETYEVQVPDAMYCLTTVRYVDPNKPSRPQDTRINTTPYIGDGRALNSTIVGIDILEGEETKMEYQPQPNHDQKCIISFFEPATMSAIKVQTPPNGTLQDGNGKRKFSLLYNGPTGLFETFYRDYDNLLRNSMHEVEVELLLPELLKQNVQAHRKVVLNGFECFWDVIRYNLGVRNEVMTSNLFTANLYEPIDKALAESERMKKDRTGYRFRLVKSERETISEEEYLAAGKPAYDVKKQKYEEALDPIYPPLPTKQTFETGGHYYSRYCYGYGTTRDRGKYYYRYEVHLEVEAI